MKLSKLFAALTFVITGLAQAAPVTPLDFSAGWNTGYSITGTSSVDGNVDWFVFDTNGVGATSFYFDRTVAAPDLIAGLYRGDTTGFDYAAAGADAWYSYSQANFYNNALTHVGTWDDIHQDRFGGPYGDPDFSMVLAAGRYSLALSSLGAGGTYQFSANETAAAVPEPATTALLGLGLLGFAASRRKSAKSKNA